MKTYAPGRYEVPAQMSEEHVRRAMQQHKGRYLEAKVVPENKLASTSENKAPVAKVRRRRTRAKSDT